MNFIWLNISWLWGMLLRSISQSSWSLVLAILIAVVLLLECRHILFLVWIILRVLWLLILITEERWLHIRVLLIIAGTSPIISYHTVPLFFVSTLQVIVYWLHSSLGNYTFSVIQKICNRWISVIEQVILWNYRILTHSKILSEVSGLVITCWAIIVTEWR